MSSAYGSRLPVRKAYRTPGSSTATSSPKPLQHRSRQRKGSSSRRKPPPSGTSATAGASGGGLAGYYGSSGGYHHGSYAATDATTAAAPSRKPYTVGRSSGPYSAAYSAPSASSSSSSSRRFVPQPVTRSVPASYVAAPAHSSDWDYSSSSAGGGSSGAYYQHQHYPSASSAGHAATAPASSWDHQHYDTASYAPDGTYYGGGEDAAYYEGRTTDPSSYSHHDYSYSHSHSHSHHHATPSASTSHYPAYTDPATDARYYEDDHHHHTRLPSTTPTSTSSRHRRRGSATVGTSSSSSSSSRHHRQHRARRSGTTASSKAAGTTTTTTTTMSSTAPARVDRHRATSGTDYNPSHASSSTDYRKASRDSAASRDSTSSRASGSSAPAAVMSAKDAVRAAAAAAGAGSDRFDAHPKLARTASAADLPGMPPSSGAPRGLVGLANMGNTCFMNSCLQCLSNVPQLTSYFYTSSFKSHLNKKSPTKGKLASAYGTLVSRMWRAGAGGAERPSEVKSIVSKVASRFLGYDQQDAQEFLRFFLDTLHEDTNQATDKSYEELQEKPTDSDKKVSGKWWAYYCKRNDSIIKDLFAGQLKSSVTCKRCGYVSRCFDPFWDLSVPIPKSAQVKSRSGGLFGSRSSGGGGSHETCGIEECLEAFITPEVLKGAESWHCPKCKRDTDSVKEMSIFRCPNVLVIHIKRFSYSTFRRTKLSTAIRFPTQGLSLIDYCAESSPERKGPPPVYDLVGVSNHMGGLGGGHYTADCLNVDDQQWHNYNDARVSGSSPSRLSEQSAYMLFYQRRAS